MKSKTYISGQITGIEKAYQNFNDAENYLIKNGESVVNPMKLPHNHDKTWNSYMRDDVKALLDCDAIYVKRLAKITRCID